MIEIQTFGIELEIVHLIILVFDPLIKSNVSSQFKVRGEAKLSTIEPGEDDSWSLIPRATLITCVSRTRSLGVHASHLHLYKGFYS